MPGARLDISSLRKKRAGMRSRLDEVAALAGWLLVAEPAQAAAGMERVVALLEDEVRPYLEWEGSILHPIVDRFACEGPATFSAPMQYEHLVVFRWIAQIAEHVRGPGPDPRSFVRLTDRLLGLLAGHFEVEDQVLLPVLDGVLPAHPAP